MSTGSPARRYQPQRRREPERHPDRHRHLQLYGQGDRRQRPDRHGSYQPQRVRRGVHDIRRAPRGEVGAAYSDTLTATGGTTPYTWSVNAGSLPPGITLSSAGVLAGTPTTAGSYAFSVNVIDTNNGIATTSITLVVAAGVSLSFAAPPGGTSTPPIATR